VKCSLRPVPKMWHHRQTPQSPCLSLTLPENKAIYDTLLFFYIGRSPHFMRTGRHDCWAPTLLVELSITAVVLLRSQYQKCCIHRQCAQTNVGPSSEEEAKARVSFAKLARHIGFCRNERGTDGRISTHLSFLFGRCFWSSRASA
jgi:hypothetical protein